MVVWNDGATPEKPIRETLYMGERLEMIDIWEKSVIPEQYGNNQTIPVTQMPVFVTGLNIDVVRFRLSMQTEVKTISAVPNRTHTIPFSYRNDSATPVSIQITPQEPHTGNWIITPESQMSNLESGIAGGGTFDLTLTQRAGTGKQFFEYNVIIAGAQPLEFNVYDEMVVGNPDVFMEFVSRLKENGDIELIQVFFNNSDNVYTYDCRLTVQGRPTRQSRVSRQGFGRTEHVYTVPRGRELIDAGVTEMLLRANPVNDARGGILGEPMVYTIPLISE